MLRTVSNLGMHFAASLIKGIMEDVHIPYHFTTAYSQWVNGCVERVYWGVLHAFRAFYGNGNFWKKCSLKLLATHRAFWTNRRLSNWNIIGRTKKDGLYSIGIPLGMNPTHLITQPLSIKRIKDIGTLQGKDEGIHELEITGRGS